MGEFAKWAILVAGAFVIVSIIFSFPFVEGIDLQEFADNVSGFLTIVSDNLIVGRGIINNFLTPVGIHIFTITIGWEIGRRFITTTLRIIVSVYHFIFK